MFNPFVNDEQEPVLFNTSIAQNIAYSKPGASQHEVERAGRMANAHDFIEGLPDKYATVAGQAGAELSGGQKQRVAIARALVREPTMLIFDEATSALDTQSEQIVQAALDELLASKRCTMLVIAHRLATVQEADQIVVLEQGTIVDRGTHDQLMRRGGRYRDLCERQFIRDLQN